MVSSQLKTNIERDDTLIFWFIILLKCLLFPLNKAKQRNQRRKLFDNMKSSAASIYKNIPS